MKMTKKRQKKPVYIEKSAIISQIYKISRIEWSYHYRTMILNDYCKFQPSILKKKIFGPIGKYNSYS